MNYVLGFALTNSNAFFVMISSQYFLKGLNIWYMMEKHIWIEKNYDKIFNQQITEFLNDRIWILFF
jgi:hypothetical protein